MPSWLPAPTPSRAILAERMAELTAVAIFRAQPGLAPSQTTPLISATMLLMPAFMFPTVPSISRMTPQQAPMAAAIEQPHSTLSRPI